jgi:hypothetical protein
MHSNNKLEIPVTSQALSIYILARYSRAVHQYLNLTIKTPDSWLSVAGEYVLNFFFFANGTKDNFANGIEDTLDAVPNTQSQVEHALLKSIRALLAARACRKIHQDYFICMAREIQAFEDALTAYNAA